MSAFKSVASIASKVLLLIVQIVPVLQLIQSIHGSSLSAADKATIIQAAKSSLLAADGVTGKDLADDPDINAAIEAVVDAVIAFHDLIARKHPATAAAA